MKIDSQIAPDAVLEELGRRVARRRIDLGLSQAAAAKAAGLGKRTIERIEAGADGQLSTLIKLLRVLELMDNLEALIPELHVRPMEMLKLKGRARLRAPRGDAPESEGEWRWGDEQ